MRVTETLFSVTLKFLCQAVTQMFTAMPDCATLLLVNLLIISKICILVWIIREKTGDNPHWESDSIDT